MRSIKILTIAVALFWATPAYAVLPVIDEAAIVKLVQQVKALAQQLEVLQAQLADMKVQAMLGPVPWNEDTEDLLDAMAEYGTDGDGLLYGGDIDEKWPEVFRGDETWEDGKWLEASVERGHHTLATQQKLAHLIKMRNDAFADDHARIRALQAVVDGANGRNKILKAQSALQAEIARQDQMNQQLSMTIANMQAVSNANEVNEKMAREAQERFFLTNGGKEPELPVFKESGL